MICVNIANLSTMALLSPAISSLARMRHWRIESWRSHPIDSQREVLQNLVAAGQYTEFGRKHNFDRIFRTKDFKKIVPISTYNDLKPYIKRMMNGQQNVLWNSPINWFAKSSGTTSEKSKYIPISEECFEDCHYKAAKDVLTMYYKFNPDSRMLTGKGLVLGGSHTVNPLNGGSQYGDLSAVLLQNSPFWGHWLRTPGLEIALMDNWEDKLEKMALQTLNENVTSISGVPTWTLILLKRLLEISGKNTISDIWPSLELYLHGGVSLTPYKKQFENIIGKPIYYLDAYNASEGFFAAQETPSDEGMLLFTDHGIFMEFMPMSEVDTLYPRTIGLKEVELNTNYALVISTNGGLWRYLLGDTIKFVSISPYKVIVSGRVKHYINAFGEEVMVDNSDEAISVACQKTGAIVNDYTAAPIYFSENTNGAHEWLIEFEKEPAQFDAFVQELDAALQSVNSDYEAKRFKNIALSPPIVHKMPKGLFNKWLQQKGKLGGQHKIPRLSNDRKYLEDILSAFRAVQQS